MRDETPDTGVEIRGIETRGTGEEVTDMLVVAVPTPNPQSRSRDSYVDDDMLVGEIPITNADVSETESRLNAEFVTVLGEHVRAYYPIEDIWVGTLTWDAATDEWKYDRQELETYSFDPKDVQFDDEESVLWRRVNDESVTR